MNDTSEKIEELRFQKMMNLSAAKRVELVCEMYMAARQAAFAAIPNGLTETERKNIFLKKMYGENVIDSIFSDASPVP